METTIKISLLLIILTTMIIRDKISCEYENSSAIPTTVFRKNLTKIAESDFEQQRNRTGSGNILVMRILSHVGMETVNEMCLSEVQQLVDALTRRETWALKVLDATGGYNPGFTLGNNHWLGSPTLCNYANPNNVIRMSYDERYTRTVTPYLLTATSPFPVHYAVVHVQHKSPYQFDMQFQFDSILHIGICVPRSCSAEEISNLTALHFTSLSSSAKDEDVEDNYFMEAIFQIHNVTILQSKIISDLPKEFTGKIGWKLLLGFFIGITILTVIGTCIKPINDSKQKNVEEDSNGNISVIFGIEESRRTEILKQNDMHLRNILNCFSASDNFSRVWDTSQKDSIPLINGIRSICCALILCWHMGYYVFYTANNPTMYFANAIRNGVALIANSAVAVDIFFAISGFLHCYHFLKDTKTIDKIRSSPAKSNLKLFGTMLLKRYNRLSIVYFLVILMGQVGGEYLWHKSQYWIHERNDLLCEKFWWRNVLYIHNLFPFNDLCVNWTWSLSCEMQFYLLLTMVLFVYAKKPWLAMTIFAALFVTFTTVALFLLLQLEFQFKYDVMFNTATWLYIFPVSRIGPYMGGIGMAWSLCETSLVSWVANNRVLRTLSIYLAPVIMFILLQFGIQIMDVPHPWPSLLFISCRCLFGLLFVGLIALSLAHNEKAGWTDFLGCSFFRHMNRLSYSIFLINGLLITILYGLREQSSHQELISYIQDTLGIMVITYVLSLLMTVFIEIPIQRVFRLYLK